MQSIEEIINTGFALHQAGRLDEAENIYREILSKDETHAETCNLMGVLKLQKGEVQDAIDWIEKAIKINQSEYFYETLFQAYIRNNDYEKIVSHVNDISKKYPANFSLLFNIALAYKNLEQNDKAITFYDKALKLDPTSYQAWFNLAHIYTIEGQAKNAVSAMKICKKLKPNDEETDYFLAIALMQLKDYDKGLKHFESRLCRKTAVALQNKTYPNLASEDRLWRGENIKDKTILVYYEAGFGDVIMFSRYLHILKDRCKKIIFYPQKPLVPLFAESGLGIDEIIEGYIPEANLDFDVHCPLLSLPYLLKLKGNKVFYRSGGYLKANKDLTKEFEKKYFHTEKLRIGIKWRGNTYYDTERVIPVEAFEPLLQMEDVQFYSLQTFEGSEELKKLADKYNIIDIGKDLLDFGQTAAAVSNIDGIICNDTSLAHLTGAMGIPCYIMLPYNVNWRWHDGKDYSEWYDSVRLYRQKQKGDWDSVIEELKQGIETCIQDIENAREMAEIYSKKRDK